MAAILWTPQTASIDPAFRVAQCPRCGVKYQDTNATAGQRCPTVDRCGTLTGPFIYFLPSP